MRVSFAATIVLVLAGCHTPFVSSRQTEAPQQPSTYTYREVDEQALTAYVFRPAVQHASKRRSAVLIFHGGGWSEGAPEWTFDAARRFAAWGMVAVPVQYRLSQGEITPIDALADVCSAFQWLRKHADEFNINPRRVAGYGVSAGGHLVASAATVGCPSGGSAEARSGPDALLLWSPALDLAGDKWFEKKLQGKASAAQYSPVEHVNASTPPTSIVHGSNDTLTPISGVKRYCERLLQSGVTCELNVYEGVGHLLTRNLVNQESNFDPDPEARADGIAQHQRFLQELRFIPAE